MYNILKTCMHIYVGTRYTYTAAFRKMRRRMNDPHPEHIDYTKYRALLYVVRTTFSSTCSSSYTGIKQQPSPVLSIPLPIVIK